MAGWSVCVEHRGRHGTLDGACIGVGRAVPRRYSYRFGSCQECGAALDVRHDNRTGRVERLEAGTEIEHVHAPPRRVELDPEELASAIVAASRATRAERRAASTNSLERLTYDVSPPLDDRAAPGGGPPPERTATPDIPTVTVWSPGPDDGSLP